MDVTDRESRAFFFFYAAFKSRPVIISLQGVWLDVETLPFAY